MNNSTVTVPHDKGARVTVDEAKGNREEASGLVVQVVPNPSSEGFILQLQSPSTLPLTIKVMDGARRIMERKEGVALYLGSTYRPGVYYVQVMQGNAQQTIKLVKQAH